MRLTLSINEVCEMTGLSRSTVWRHVWSGELPSALIGGRRLVKVSDLEDFIDRHVSAA